MGLENFIPKVWAADIFVRLRKALVHGATVNRDYEGDIRNFGDTVKINELSLIDVSTYTKGTDITWQTLDSAQKSLIIDQAKYFAFIEDDLDAIQTKPKVMNEAAQDAAYQIRDKIDQFVAGFYTAAGSSVTALTVTAGNVLVTLSNMQLGLNEANVPTDGRFLPIAPWMHQHAVNATGQTLTATGVPKLIDNSIVVNGFVGQLYGFNLLMSNNVNNNATVWNHMAYTRQAITFAMQPTVTIEASRDHDQFGDGLRGLFLYGGKTVRPNAMVTCATTKGS